jgi:hypothetical protein
MPVKSWLTSNQTRRPADQAISWRRQTHAVPGSEEAQPENKQPKPASLTGGDRRRRLLYQYTLNASLVSSGERSAEDKV